MTRITVGKGLDGGICKPPESAIGELAAGPMQLLSWLESQLGLALPEIPFTSRMVHYLGALRQAASGRFYERSLGRDEFGTARTLLQWRDAWYEAGWDGRDFPADASPRLRDMAAVEHAAGPAMPPGTGERVQRALEALASVRLDLELALLDAPESFPKVWRQLFEALGAARDRRRAEPSAPEASDLGKLQRALVGRSGKAGRQQLSGDGSVLVLRDGSPQLSAPWVARFAHARIETGESVAILAMEHGVTFDEALGEAGFPRLGYAHSSHRRPVFQVLPLALELCWRPLDPAVLLQFLSHPMGPISNRIRGRLAEVVSSQPGIGGDAWVRALEEALDAAGVDTRQAKRDALAAGVDFWLAAERFDAQAGAPMGFLLERVARVRAWLAGALAAQEEAAEAALYSAAIVQADELARALERLRDAGAATLSCIALRRLVEAVRGAGTARPGLSGQCAPGEPQMLHADSPAAVIAPVSTVIWWACDSERLPSAYPWSRAECAELAAQDVELLPLDTQLAWQADTWLRPILSAQRQLVLVLHDNADGHHPVFDEIVAVAEGWAEARVDELMRDGRAIAAAGRWPKTARVKLRALPGRRRWWELPKGLTLPSREQESFSSLEKFLFAPHSWVLEYEARIRAGRLEALEDGSRLRGNLAHALFQRYFDSHTNIAALDSGEAEAWGRANVETLIEQRGAVLLMPGRQAEKARFAATVSYALGEMVRHLQAAKVTGIAMETQLEGRFAGGGIVSTPDLVAAKAGGDMAVLDLKWSGLARRRKSMSGGNYLQLAVYAQLVHQNRGRWPALGYFIVSDARLVMLDSEFFPAALDIVRPANGESVLEYWQRVEQTWRWRRGQLDLGLVEVPVEGTEPDEDPVLADTGLPMPATFDDYDDYWALTGWQN